MRNLGTPLGLLLGILCIFGAFLWEGGTIGSILLGPAILIVLGGTFAATMIGIPFKDFVKIIKLIKIAFFPKKYELKKTINEIVEYSAIARKEGILSLERIINGINDDFFQKFIKYAIDGTEPEIIKVVGEIELRHITNRHEKYFNIFKKMGGYSPTMGIIGTVMGLITTLANAGSEPEVLVRHIATAFIATLWGIFMANLVWLPIADRLKNIHLEEEIYMEIVIQGTLSIQSGDIPSFIKSRLYTVLPLSEQLIEKKFN
jgi:chemotaxis protein MotA